ncbi:MAG: FkbM family methyltransferase [Alistipes sp.]|jgi:FkbM family methyltransferase|nr:FkbM family methyltransferase [Alistipes sp.]
MSITSSIKRLLYRRLSLENYLKVLSAGFFAGMRLGLGKNSAAYEYPRFLRRVVRVGDVVIDIGANLGYYSREISRLVGVGGKVYAVEPVRPILGVLARNLRRRSNVEIVPCALGTEERTVTMVNDSSRYTGYMGTGRNYIPKSEEEERADTDLEFEADMRRGSELFAKLDRLDFVKCDVEGYEGVIIPEMEPVILKHHPIVLLETGGAQRRRMIELFRGWGYGGYVLDKGRLVSVMRAPEKDIFFIPAHRHKELI